MAARIQSTFGGGGKDSGLFYAPGECFSDNIDLLTRYDALLCDKITANFYAPPLLKPRVEDRITVPVASLAPVASLPKLSPAVLKYAMVPGTGNANVFQCSSLNHTYVPSDSLVKCEEPCGTCKTAPLQDFHARDRQILAAAESKLRKKVTAASHPAPSSAQKVRVVAGLASRAAGLPAVAPAPGPTQESETADPGPSSCVGPCAAPAP